MLNLPLPESIQQNPPRDIIPQEFEDLIRHIEDIMLKEDGEVNWSVVDSLGNTPLRALAIAYTQVSDVKFPEESTNTNIERRLKNKKIYRLKRTCADLFSYIVNKRIRSDSPDDNTMTMLPGVTIADRNEYMSDIIQSLLDYRDRFDEGNAYYKTTHRMMNHLYLARAADIVPLTHLKSNNTAENGRPVGNDPFYGIVNRQPRTPPPESTIAKKLLYPTPPQRPNVAVRTARNARVTAKNMRNIATRARAAVTNTRNKRVEKIKESLARKAEANAKRAEEVAEKLSARIY
jgi:hypothetical protein